MNMSINFPGLDLQLEYVPRILNIFGFNITIYGLLLSLGMLLALLFIVLESKRCQLNQNYVMGAALFGLIGAIAGGRLFYIFFSGTDYSDLLQKILNIRDGGMAFYGALFGGIIFTSFFCLIAHMDFMKTADVLCLGILIVQIFSRLGDFFNRGSFGEYTENILAMQLPISAVKASEITNLMREHIVEQGQVSYIQVHPIFLYEMLWCFGMLMILMAVQRRKKYQGEIFMRYLTLYAICRCWTEYLRTDKLYIPGTRIPISLVISAILAVVFFIVSTIKRTMAIKRIQRKRKRLEKDITD